MPAATSSGSVALMVYTGAAPSVHVRGWGLMAIGGQDSSVGPKYPTGDSCWNVEFDHCEDTYAHSLLSW